MGHARLAGKYLGLGLHFETNLPDHLQNQGTKTIELSVFRQFTWRKFEDGGNTEPIGIIRSDLRLYGCLVDRDCDKLRELCS